MNLPAPDDPHALLVELCRRDFGAFLRKAWPHISGGELLKWNWHIDAVIEQLGRVAKGDARRVLFNIPPRNGKSKVISVVWVAWMLGKNPRLNFLGVSYSNELSAKMARDCRSVMETPWYREIFPRTIISRARSAQHDFETTLGGGRLSTSVTGTLTGRGGDIIILDDVIKPEEAMTDLLLGSLAVALCILAVAIVGLLMFSGRLPIRKGLQVVLGSFVLLGAPLIAGGFTGWWEGNREFAPPPDAVSNESVRPELPPAQFDPYAGPSLRQD